MANRTAILAVRIIGDASRANRELNRTARNVDRLTGPSRRASSALSGLGRATRSALKGGLIAALGIEAAGAIPQILSLTASLVPLAGGLVGIPGVAVAAGGALAALKVGLSGFSDALASMSDPKKFAEALKQLAPAAQATARAVKDVAPAWRNLRRTVQDQLFAGIAKQIKPVSAAILPELRSGLTANASAWNSVARAAGPALAKLAKTGAIQAMMEKGAATVRALSGAVGPLTHALGQLLSVTANRAGNLGQTITSLTKKFDAWITKANQSGKLSQWLDQALSVARSLGSVLLSVGRIIGGVVKAASGAGAGIKGLSATLSKVADVVNSPAFQTGLSGFFKGLAAGSRGINSALPAVGRALAALGPIVGRLASTLGPILGTALKAVARAAQTLAPALGPIVTGLGAGLRPIVAALGPLLTSVARALRPLGPMIGRLAATLGTQLGAAIAAMTPSIVSLVKQFVALAPTLVSIVAGVSKLLPVIAPLVPYVLTLVAALKAWRIVQVVLNAVLLANPLMAVITLIGLLVAAVILAWKHSKTLRTVVLAVWHAVKAAVMPIVKWFAKHIPAAFKKIVDFVKKYWPLLVGIVLGPVAAIVALVVKNWGKIKSATRALVRKISGILTWFGTLDDKFSRWWNRAKNAAVNKARDLVRWMKGLPGKISNGIGNLKNLLWNAGWNVIKGLVSGIKSAAHNILKGALSWVTGLIPDWKGPASKDKRLLTPAGKLIIDGLMAGIDGALPKLRRQLTGVSSLITNGVSADPTVDISATGAARRYAGGARAPISLNVEFSGVVGDPPAVAQQLRKLLNDYGVLVGEHA